MNYYGPERDDAGRWRYVRVNDGRAWAVGYCANCEGHDDPEGAVAHQREFDLDQAVERGPERTEPWAPCGVCGRRTPWCWSVGPGLGRAIHLCDEHRGRERLASLYGGAWRVVSSY